MNFLRLSDDWVVSGFPGLPTTSPPVHDCWWATLFSAVPTSWQPHSDQPHTKRPATNHDQLPSAIINAHSAKFRAPSHGFKGQSSDGEFPPADVSVWSAGECNARSRFNGDWAPSSCPCPPGAQSGPTSSSVLCTPSPQDGNAPAHSTGWSASHATDGNAPAHSTGWNASYATDGNAPSSHATGWNAPSHATDGKSPSHAADGNSPSLTTDGDAPSYTARWKSAGDEHWPANLGCYYAGTTSFRSYRTAS